MFGPPRSQLPRVPACKAGKSGTSAEQNYQQRRQVTCQWPFNFVMGLCFVPVSLCLIVPDSLSLWLLSFKNYYMYFVWGFGEQVPVHL